MNKFELLQEGIYRLCVPFENIYTSVFLLKNERGSIVVDSATTDSDVENYIFPALKQSGTVPDILICSHLHADHSGGMERLVKEFPDSTVALIDKNKVFENKTVHSNDGEILLGQFEVLNLKGHTPDSLGILDLRTNTLLSFDSLQQNGVGRFKTYIQDKNDYLNTLKRLKNMGIKKIICSHEYEPFGFSVERDNVLKCLIECENAVK